MEIQKNDSVKSYDFPDRKDLAFCGVEGVVTDIVTLRGCKRYEITVNKTIWMDKEVAIKDEKVYPPINGTPTSLGRITNGVEKV